MGDDLFNRSFGTSTGDFPEFREALNQKAFSDRESIDINDYLSEQTKEFLQKAGEKAVELGKTEVDTEHLLYVLPESEVVQAILKLGAPPGYVGYDEGGQLTERVRRRPYSVILLDEIEKAHADVSNVLLQVFDDGRLTDGKGRVVDFTNTIIIATSNLGSDLIVDNLQAETRLDDQAMKAQLMDVLRHHFRPEFLNRIDEIIVFHALSQQQIKDIVNLQLEQVRRMAEDKDIQLQFDSNLIDYLAEAGYQPEFGARELRRLIRQRVETQLATDLLQGELQEGDSATITYDQDLDKVTIAKPVAALQL